MPTRTKIDGILRDPKKHFDKIFKLKRQAMIQAMSPAKKDVKKELARDGRSGLKVVSKTFMNLYRVQEYKKKLDKMPSARIYANPTYWMIHENGGTISSKTKKGIFIPFFKNWKKLKQKRINQLLMQLKATGNTFWKKTKGGDLILLLKTEKGMKANGLNKIKSSYRSSKGVKTVKNGTIIPVGILKKSVRLRKRINYNYIANTVYRSSLVRNYESLLRLP